MQASPGGALAPAAAAPAAAAAAAAEEGPPPGLWPKVGYYWFELRWRVRQVVDHWAFGALFMALIVGNTVLLAMTTAGGLGRVVGRVGWVGQHRDVQGTPPPRPRPAWCGAGMSAALRARLDAASTVFTALFTAECGAKLLGLGVAGFAGDGMNLFDAAVVVLSLVDALASVSLAASLLPLPPAQTWRPRMPGRWMSHPLS